MTLSPGNRSGPLVGVVTPVYNEAEHLAQCIESVIAQTYPNWSYTIVDNCSTDGTAEIAASYAAKDGRIRLIRNSSFLRAVANYNHALRHIPTESKYCKVVFGDDWIFPECLQQMVALAEEYPSIGVVGAYGLQGNEVMWTGLPYSKAPYSGTDVCRRLFLDETYVFGSATSLLYRADLVRGRNPFYNEANLHSDVEACIMLLKSSDFGFVHQVLTYTREQRPTSLRTLSENLNTYVAGRLHDLVTHGKDFLSPEELERCVRREITKYDNFLAVSLLHGRLDKKFWAYHRGKLDDEGIGFSRVRIAKAMVARFLRAVFNPNETLYKLTWGRKKLSPGNLQIADRTRLPMKETS